MLLNLEKQNTTNNCWNFFAKFSLFFSSSSSEEKAKDKRWDSATPYPWLHFSAAKH